MTKAVKVSLIVGLLAFFFIVPIVTMWAMQSVFIWWAYWRYVDEISNLTGISNYLITAAGLLMFIPFWFGATRAFSLGSRRRRYEGAAILIGLAVLYNLSLFWVTREISFSTSGGAPIKWYALTPEGVKFYDRAGVDPNYGIQLKPVTPEVIRKLKLLEKGEFKPVDPARVTFFNPITGEAQVWYYRYPDGALEFYDKPGHHPLTGAPLQAVTQEVYFEWRKTQKGKISAPAAPENTRAPQRPSGDGQAKPSGVIEVKSTPQGAETYLNWRPKGETPAQLEDKGGLLVVLKDGYRAAFKRVEPKADGEIEITLERDVTRSRKRLLLVISEGPADAGAALRSQLIEQGFSVLGIQEGVEFAREVERAGGLSNRVLRAWARSRFDSDLAVFVRARQSSRELSDQELSYLGIRDAVKGVVRTEVGIDAEVVDLRSGDNVTAASAKGSGFGLDRAQGVQKAVVQAATESAKLLRQRLQG